MRRFSLLLLISFTISLFSFSSFGAEGRRILNIGTGAITGIYYPIGGALCRLINNTPYISGYKCFAEISSGSVSNLSNLKDGKVKLALIQSEIQYNSYNQIGALGDPRNKKLRSLFSLHDEVFTIVARAGKGVDKLRDMVGKRINIGAKGSGSRVAMEAIMQSQGWTVDDFQRLTSLSVYEQAEALCTGKIDVAVYSVGHPNGALHEAMNMCENILVPIEGRSIDLFVKENEYFTKTFIKGGMYAGAHHDVNTIGVKATLVTLDSMPESLVYSIVKALFENLDRFKEMHPAFENLDAKEMIKEGLTAPLHRGAAKYYGERGMSFR
jgi:uncharacterized protein